MVLQAAGCTGLASLQPGRQRGLDSFLAAKTASRSCRGVSFVQRVRESASAARQSRKWRFHRQMNRHWPKTWDAERVREIRETDIAWIMLRSSRDRQCAAFSIISHSVIGQTSRQALHCFGSLEKTVRSAQSQRVQTVYMWWISTGFF